MIHVCTCLWRGHEWACFASAVPLHARRTARIPDSSPPHRGLKAELRVSAVTETVTAETRGRPEEGGVTQQPVPSTFPNIYVRD